MSENVIVTRPFMDPQSWGIYALCYMQVCAFGECPPSFIEDRANELNPSGTSTPWRVTAEGPDGIDLSPVRCEDDPVRLHYMLSC